jgi:hypothetical protein
MRTGKRALAGVAAGALALGALTIASAPAVSAKPSIKPKASVTAAANAVRPTGTGATALSLPQASMEWSGAATLGTNRATIDLTTAPTAAARVFWGSASDDSVTLLQADQVISEAAFTTPDGYQASVDDSAFYFNVDTAGTYAGIIFNGTDTAAFSFATAGAPTSMTVTPATQTVLVGSVADLQVNLLDAAGKATQPQIVDSVGLTRSSTDDTLTLNLTPASSPPFAPITGLTSSLLATGSGAFSLATTPSTAGTTTVTATPAGTLTSSGVTAQTATVVKSGTVSPTRVNNLTVSTPANAFNAGTVLAGTRAAQVQNPTTSVTITVDDTPTASAGNKLRFAVYSSAAGATVNGAAAGTTLATAQFVDVTTDANKRATLTYTLGGTALLAGNSITVAQVTVLDAAVANSQIVVTQTAATVQRANVVPSPTTALAKVGASTNIVVQVDDSFGADQVGWIVRSYRTSVSNANLISTATTGSNGAATVTVSPLATTTNGQSETYVFTATAPVGGTAVESLESTTVAYTTSGNVASMTITPATGTGNAFSSASSTLTTIPAITVPDDTSGVPLAATSAAYTLSTATGTANGAVASFGISTSPGANVVVTVSDASGLYLRSTAPTSTTAWSSGAKTVTVASGGSVWVWGTKVGTQDVVFTAEGATLTGKVRVSNAAQDAYNMALTPDKESLSKGGFKTLTAKVTDYWGNPVALATVQATAAGQVLLGGYLGTNSFTTGATGEVSITIIGANDVGAGTVTLGVPTGSTVPAWQTTYNSTRPASLTVAPVTSAVSAITVGEAPATKSITITGSRTTVGGKPGIEVNGITVGFENGKTVIPYFRFPGETSYTEGTARPVITDDEFTWTRKTGKKFYAYVTSDDGAVQSNRVIIEAN